MSASSQNLFPVVNCLAIRGVGLIGGSVALAARKQGVARKIIGIGTHAGRLQRAVDLGVIDEFTTDPEEGASQAEVIVVATPVDCIAHDVIRMHRTLPDTGWMTDAGSVKEQIVRQIGQELGEGHRFIGAHPLAGSEKTGFENARSDLYEGAMVVLTPDPETESRFTQSAQHFWQALGAKVVEMSASEHDQILARTSHLPHLVSAAMAAQIRPSDFPFASTGFGDTTRIAAGDPDLWTAIFRLNREATLASGQLFLQTVQDFLEAIKQDDQTTLQELLKNSKQLRDGWSESRNGSIGSVGE